MICAFVVLVCLYVCCFAFVVLVPPAVVCPVSCVLCVIATENHARASMRLDV